WQRNAAAEPSSAIAHLGRDRHGLGELAAQHPKIPQDSALAGPEWGQLYQIDRNDITGLGAAHDDRPGYRSQGVSVTSRGERRRYRADVLDVVKSAAHFDRKLLTRIDSHRRWRVSIDGKQIFGPVGPHLPLPKH